MGSVRTNYGRAVQVNQSANAGKKYLSDSGKVVNYTISPQAINASVGGTSNWKNPNKGPSPWKNPNLVQIHNPTYVNTRTLHMAGAQSRIVHRETTHKTNMTEATSTSNQTLSLNQSAEFPTHDPSFA